MNTLFSKGSLERIIVACAAVVVAMTFLVFYGIYVVKMPDAIHQTMMQGQPPEFVALFEWQDWEAPSDLLRQDHQSEYAGDFEVRHGVLQMLLFKVNVIQARGPGETKFLDGLRGEVRVEPKTRTIAGMAGVFVLIVAAAVMWLVKSIQTRRRMLRDGTVQPV